jgi:hypothetical protein
MGGKRQQLRPVLLLVVAVLYAAPTSRAFETYSVANARRMRPLAASTTTTSTPSEYSTTVVGGGKEVAYLWGALRDALDSEEEGHVVRALSELKAVGELQVFNATELRYRRYDLDTMKLSTGLRGDIATQLGLTGSRDIDRIASITLGLTLLAFVGSTSVIQLLPGPDMVRFVASWIIAFLPYGFLSLGIGSPESLQKGLVSVFRLNAGYRNRLIQHEAGHFLCAHCVGLPVKSIQANDAVTNAVSFYPSVVRKTVLGFPEEEAIKLAVVSMGGIVAESRACGTSEGGYADLSQLESVSIPSCFPPLSCLANQVGNWQNHTTYSPANSDPPVYNPTPLRKGAAKSRALRSGGCAHALGHEQTRV